MNRFRNLDLKMPDVAVPDFLSDLFYDLRDRRLLPLVALLVVAIVAAPFLLSGSDSEPGEGGPLATPPGASASAASGKRLTVVTADQGLRKPSKRLGHLSAKDPFQQKYTGPANGGAAVTQTSTEVTETSTSVTEVSTETSAEPTGGAPTTTAPTTSPQSPSSDGNVNGQPVTVFTFAIDLKVVKTTTNEAGEKSKSEPETRERVMPATTLPGKKTQAVTYLGISPKEKKPLFLVSEDVTAVFGEADCVAGSSSCQLLELEPGFPLTLLYGPNDVRYKFTVLKVEPVATGHF